MKKVLIIACATLLVACMASCEKHIDGTISWGHGIHYSSGENPNGIPISEVEAAWDNAFSGIGEASGSHGSVIMRNTTEKQLQEVAANAAKKAEAAMPPATTKVKNYGEFTYSVYISLGGEQETKVYSVTYNKE